MQVRWSCNLDDVLRYEKFDENLVYRPMVGDLVRSKVRYRTGCIIELEVVRCTIITSYLIEAELNLVTSRWGGSISNWERWYREARSQGAIPGYAEL